MRMRVAGRLVLLDIRCFIVEPSPDSSTTAGGDRWGPERKATYKRTGTSVVTPVSNEYDKRTRNKDMSRFDGQLYMQQKNYRLLSRLDRSPPDSQECRMDLGIQGRCAILMASSRGLGRACAESLAREGVHLVINGRTPQDLQETCDKLRAAYAVNVTAVVGDATTTEVHDALLQACPEPDIVLLNSEGPTPRAFADIDAEAWADTLERTMTAPLLFVQRVIEGMQERKFGRIVAISSAMVKSPNPLMSMSHGPRLGLTGVLKGLSKTAVAHNVTVNTMLPERFDTGRQEQMAQIFMQLRGVTYEEARAQQIASINAGRLGRPEEFGDTFAFLCSAQASFISGQSIQLDGGSYVGVF